MSDQGIERLNREMEGLGQYGRDDRPAEISHRRTPTELAPDQGPASHRCGVCCRPIDPRRKHPIWPGEFACGTCFDLRVQQGGEWIYRHWFARPWESRRRALALHYGFDPFTRQASPTEVEHYRAPTDSDGLPMSIEVERKLDRIETVGIPVCYWSIARERGWLYSQP
jgi:hypothetical protein